MELSSSTAKDIGDASLAVRPLGAGDLIDRAVRFYRQNFAVFISIAAVPVVLGTVISMVWTLLMRYLFPAGPGAGVDDLQDISYLLALWAGSVAIWFTEAIATVAVMGGASRNFVRHLLFGEAITFRETYRSTWSRLPGLIAAALVLIGIVGTITMAVMYMGLLVTGAGILIASYALRFSTILLSIAVFIIGAAGGVLTFLAMMYIVSRFAYVPQVMLVEGQGVMSSISRSISLARGNVKRFSALVVFSVVITYSALAILFIPLMWYASLQGVPIFGGDQNTLPLWYEISAQLISQASLIVLTPVWMIGMCLLYVDERVRHEGYDIELLAARRLGDIPTVPDEYLNPLQPALSATTAVGPPVRPLAGSPVSQPRPKGSGSMLGLDG